MTATGVPHCDRLTFRPPTTADCAFFFQLMNQADYHHFIGDRGIRSPSDAKTYVRDRLAPTFLKRGFGLWIVELADHGGPIGICGLVDRDDFDAPDIGYAVLSEHQGRGFALEGAQAVLAFCLDQLRLTSVLAIATP